MRASRGISIHTGMAFLRNEFYNMSIYRVSFWINLFYTFLMMYSVGYVWRALYAANPNVSGVPLPQMISYAVLGVALRQSCIHGTVRRSILWSKSAKVPLKWIL